MPPSLPPPGSDPEWAVVSLVVDGELVEPVVADLWGAGVAGIEERPRPGGGPGPVELLAAAPVHVVDRVRRVVAHHGEVEVSYVGEHDWLDAWRPWAQAWRADGRLVVVPAWLDDPDWLADDDVVVRLDPGPAFGSGAHPTTRLCLAELAHRLVTGDRVIDAGTGSGVLAVAAARLGASVVDAVDVDDEAVRATEANALANGVAQRVRVSLDPVEALPGGYDLVVANIGAATLADMAPALVGAARPGATFVLSGVLAGQVDQVTDAMTAAGAAAGGAAADGEWRALVFRRAP